MSGFLLGKGAEMSNFWKGRPVLITGCFGFLPSWLAAALVKKGAEVTGLTSGQLSGTALKALACDRKIKVLRASVADYEAVRKVFAGYRFEYCFHLAALTDYGVCSGSPLATFETNIKGSWNVLEAARKCGTLRGVVLASSDKVYGEQNKLPYTEAQPLLGRHPYDVSKICDELIGLCYSRSYGLPVAAARCANIYGGGDFTWSRVVPGTIRSVLRGDTPVIRSDGTPTRDYLYVEDAVDAYLKLAEALGTGRADGGAFNFSPENPTTTLQLVELILALAGKLKIKPKVLGAAGAACRRDIQSLSSAKSRKELKWQAAHSLKEGLRKTLRWYIKYFNENPSCLSSDIR